MHYIAIKSICDGTKEEISRPLWDQYESQIGFVQCQLYECVATHTCSYLSCDVRTEDRR